LEAIPPLGEKYKLTTMDKGDVNLKKKKRFKSEVYAHEREGTRLGQTTMVCQEGREGKRNKDGGAGGRER